RLYVCNMANKSLDVVDLKKGDIVKSFPGQDGIRGVAYEPKTDRLFATCAPFDDPSKGIVTIFDAEALKGLKSHKVADANDPFVDPRSGLIYFRSGDKSLGKIDPKTMDLKMPAVPLPSAPAAF